MKREGAKIANRDEIVLSDLQSTGELSQLSPPSTAEISKPTQGALNRLEGDVSLQSA